VDFCSQHLPYGPWSGQMMQVKRRVFGLWNQEAWQRTAVQREYTSYNNNYATTNNDAKLM